MNRVHGAMLVAGICSILMAGCGTSHGSTPSSNQTVTQKTKTTAVDPYLSITSTEKTLSMHFFKYDLKTREMSEIDSVPLTAQYSLGAIDDAQKTLYFTQRDSNRKDQLMKRDLTTHIDEKLTDNLAAINFIIPNQEKVFLVTRKAGDHNETLASYDQLTKKVTFWMENDQDTAAQALTENPFTHHLYAILYSSQERANNTKKAEETQADDVKPAMHRVVEYDENGNVLKELYRAQEEIVNFIVSKDETRALMRTAPMVFQKRALYLIDMKTMKKELLQVDNFPGMEHLAFAPNGEGFYFTAASDGQVNKELTDHSPNALYYYDFASKKVEQILAHKDQYVNNFLILN